MSRHLFTAWLVFGSAFILAGTSFALRPYDFELPAHHVACQSQVASLTAALYLAEGERCPSLGVHPVPPARKGARR